jgi:hypothetical protein
MGKKYSIAPNARFHKGVKARSVNAAYGKKRRCGKNSIVKALG